VAIEVIADTVHGTQFDQSGFSRYSATRGYLVRGLTASGESKLAQALTASDGTTTVPDYGDPFPGFESIQVTKKSVRPVPGNSSSAEVTVTYDVPGGTIDTGPPDDFGTPEIEVGATLETVETTLDNAGQPLLLQYDTGDGVLDHVARVQINIPRNARRASRVEQTSPEARSRAFVGRVNSAGVWGSPPRTWLCAELRGRSNDGGQSWQVSYQFVYAADTWDRRLTFLNDAGQVPSDAHLQPNAIKTFQVLPEADFTVLAL